MGDSNMLSEDALASRRRDATTSRNSRASTREKEGSWAWEDTGVVLREWYVRGWGRLPVSTRSGAGADTARPRVGVGGETVRWSFSCGMSVYRSNISSS